MKMITKLKLGAASLMLSGGMAYAAVTAESIVADLQAQGYTWIEVKRGPTQIKVEAVKGNTKVETVIDSATGTVLEREVERADADDVGRTGVEVRNRSRDFVRVSGGVVMDDDDGDDRDDD
ncbi:MAG: PepSY domain-containing protein, partial [Cypionkella sp.]|nr:PepSY domain-containing protein [Cypionkella sp.]